MCAMGYSAWIGFLALPEFGCAGTWCLSVCINPSSLPRGNEKMMRYRGGFSNLLKI